MYYSTTSTRVYFFLSHEAGKRYTRSYWMTCYWGGILDCDWPTPPSLASVRCLQQSLEELNLLRVCLFSVFYMKEFKIKYSLHQIAIMSLLGPHWNNKPMKKFSHNPTMCKKISCTIVQHGPPSQLSRGTIVQSRLLRVKYVFHKNGFYSSKASRLKFFTDKAITNALNCILSDLGISGVNNDSYLDQHCDVVL